MNNIQALKKIIVADDDSAILDVIKIILEDEGYTVETTLNGAHVLEKAKKFQPQLILLDIWMSGEDGRDICRRLKENSATKQIPVIMISANRDMDKMSQECGADDCIAKPFEMSELLAKVKQYTKNS